MVVIKNEIDWIFCTNEYYEKGVENFDRKT